MSRISNLYDDSVGRDKTFTVPANRAWHIIFGVIDYISDGTGSNRSIGLEGFDELGNRSFTIDSPEEQLPGAAYVYSVQQGVTIPPVATTTRLQLAIPRFLIMLPNHSALLTDINSQSLGDSTVISLTYRDMSLAELDGYVR